MATGLVVAAHGRRGILQAGGLRRPYLVKGRRIRAVCGDQVAFEEQATEAAVVVTAVAGRRNVLERWRDDTRGDEIVAANIDQMIVVAATEPAPERLIIDRYLCAAELMPCRSVVVWNKCDRGSPPEQDLQDYRDLGYAVVLASAVATGGLAALAGLLTGRVSVLVGQSGVGKSSIINALFADARAAVGALSAGSKAGMHTTTAAVMYGESPRARLVDTPGVRNFMPYLGAATRLDTGFPELRRLAPGCRFADCRHTHEPGCNVKAALAAGGISARRYESYCRLLELVSDGQRSTVT